MNTEGLLRQVSDSAPCGEDLEYDVEFSALEEAVRHKPAQRSDGEAAAQPNWSDVQARAAALLERSKDVRIAAHLTRALLHTEGLTGFTDGLGVTRGLIEHYWDGVHPRLDSADNDPTMRVNALMAVCDAEGMLRDLRRAPLVASRTLGQFSLRDTQLATGKLVLPEGSEESPPQASLIDGAFQDCELEALQTTAEAAGVAGEHVSALEKLLRERVDMSLAPNLDPLATTLRDIRRVVTEHLSRRGVPTKADEPAAETNPAQDIGPAPTAPVPPAGGEIASREQAVHELDKICAYFERYEPSSPVPLLLRRARRLVAKDFMDIIRDLAPDAVSQAEQIGGRQDEE